MRVCCCLIQSGRRGRAVQSRLMLDALSMQHVANSVLITV